MDSSLFIVFLGLILFLWGRDAGERSLHRFLRGRADVTNNTRLPVMLGYLNPTEYYIVPRDEYLEMQKRLKVLDAEPPV